MLVEVVKRNIRSKERGVPKGAFVTKVFCLVSELAATKEPPEGNCRRGNRIDFVDLLILCHRREVYIRTKCQFEDIKGDRFSLN
jgi:hypothetical protein